MENSSVAHAVEWLMTGRIDTPAAIHEEMNETSFQASLFFNKHFIDLLYVLLMWVAADTETAHCRNTPATGMRTLAWG